MGAALVLLALAAVLICPGPARSADFTDSAGRRVVLPDRALRVMPAERNAEVLVFVLAPERLAGLSLLPGRGALLPGARRLPVVGWRPRSNPASMAETARRLRPDLIIDAGTVTPDRAAFAEQVQQLTGIPYILVDDSFARMPRVLRSVGALLGVGDRAEDLAIYAEHAIAGLRGRLLIRSPDSRPHVYYGRRSDGLETAPPGSAAGAAIDQAGAINVAAMPGQSGPIVVTRAQLVGWDPEIIIAQQRSFYDALLRGPAWRRLSAVRNKHVYLAPASPYGWIDDPPGVNRLIGLYWLSGLFYPDKTEEDLRAVTRDFYAKFYGIKLTDKQIEAMVRPAGAPPPESMHPIGGPMVGLGAAPPLAMPPGGRAARSGAASGFNAPGALPR